MVRTTHVLFDMDGLLLEDPYSDANNKILARYGLVYTWEVKQKIMGHKETDAAKLFLQHYKIPMSPEAYLTERKRILAELYPYCKPLPGVMKLVQHLKEHNVPICVATSSTRDAFIMKSSKNEELFRHFDGNVTCSSDGHIQRGKPAPDLFLAGANSLGLQTDVGKNNKNCLVFEDSPMGVKAGLVANMNVVWIPDENLTLDEDLVKRCVKVLRSMEDFVPEEFGLPPYPL
ncbi:HAD-like protein [Rhizoclosmatium globosum]|uniref:HAD-like protein n=1 Tax=Rhizoclosmatium globosum TaxID=329046 RepID=A0A1Y2BTQ3_9FUNG|nr:HAD-like protein [Rhizoclosmatium globosum]|eukprot:ORY38132.1 HAD-like protein [Rhizoclosmatium globosum]